MELENIGRLRGTGGGKIVMLVLDGLGGLPREAGGPTELEAARTPHLDELAAGGICGLHQPAGPGVTPGSGPAHLALFGYDPWRYDVGRGVLAALGIGLELGPGDVAARGNFCTVDARGIVTDRRAGRIATEVNQRLCEKLGKISVPGTETVVRALKEHRFVLILRGEGLSGELEDTDPQVTGKAPLAPQAMTEEARATEAIVTRFIEAASRTLADDAPANMVLMRGFSSRPDWPSFPEVFGLNAAAIAAYPMYRGVARLLGMQVLETGDTVADEVETLVRNFEAHDFIYLHVKGTDSAGEDGDFDRKVRKIEELDALMPRVMGLGPDVVIVTGDHSTPSVLKQHSWHPVPVLLWSRRCRPDGVRSFGETACTTGGLGTSIPAIHLLPLAVANAMRLDKFGA